MSASTPDQGRKGAVAPPERERLKSVAARPPRWAPGGASVPAATPESCPRPAVLLIALDGSQASRQTLQYAAARSVAARIESWRAVGARRELVLLYVSPSGRVSDLAIARRELEHARQTCRVLARHGQVRTRLVVGKSVEAIPAVARDERADLIVMGSHRVDGFPHMETLSRVARETIAGAHCPVVVISPTGAEVRDEGQEMREAKLSPGWLPCLASGAASGEWSVL